jgi:predicted nucleic acid-binding protein
MRNILLDAGSLVALFAPDDKHHSSAKHMNGRNVGRLEPTPSLK